MHMCVCVCVTCGWCRRSDCIGVVGCKCMQVAKLTKAALDVCNVDLHIILEATGKKQRDSSVRRVRLRMTEEIHMSHWRLKEKRKQRKRSVHLRLEGSIEALMSFRESVRDLNSNELRSPPSARHWNKSWETVINRSPPWLIKLLKIRTD